MKRWASSGRKEIYETGSGFYHYMEKVFDLIAVSIFTLLGCLPVLTAGASFCALYRAAAQSVRRDIGTVSGKFWNSFKQNIKTSIPLWALFGGGIFLLLLNFGIARSRFPGLFGLFFQMFYFFAALLMIAAANYAFAALSRFDMPFGWIVKLAFYLTFRHLPQTLLLILLAAGAYLLLLLNLFTVLIVPGIYAYLASSLIDPLLDRHEADKM